ncbi:GNAT family N-acetyltransferase [Streptomyces sp. NPDC051561]|uniref:GNAT family N-acetyltransferase n=1 Tax=Streptomyces sp. NPDC051561 TaxID=3365658 RepID=UPI0037A15905
MTTTLRPTGPLQTGADGARSRSYDVCVNSRPVGTAEIATEPAFGPTLGRIRSLRINEPDRRRGRGTVAALAAEEVLRGWRCDQVAVTVPADAQPAVRMVTALGYVERSRNMLKDLPPEPPALPAGFTVRPMTPQEYEGWRRHSRAGFERSWIERGFSAEQARAKAEAGDRQFLPDGLATAHTSISQLLHDGEKVGFLWTGRHEVQPGEQVPFVFDVEVDVAHRGRGYGRALMTQAERVALESGGTRLGLHVFAGNTPALRLYESLGYRTTHLNSFKALL